MEFIQVGKYQVTECQAIRQKYHEIDELIVNGSKHSDFINTVDLELKCHEMPHKQ